MTESKTATERLRELLDARGMEWFGSYDSDETCWDVGELTWVYFNDGNIAGLGVAQGDITPEQAIAATLGSGERICECGWHGFVDGWGFNPSSYCPNCGGKRVDA